MSECAVCGHCRDAHIVAVSDDRKTLVLDLCVLCRLLGVGAVNGDDNRHQLADISDFVASQRVSGAR